MIKIPQKKRYSFLVLLISAIFLAVYYSIPLSEKLNSFLRLIDPVFDENTPIIYLSSGEISFDRQAPHQIVLENGVHILFDAFADSTVLDTLPPFSILVATDKILYKTKEETKEILVKDIEIERDHIEINPVKVGILLKKFSSVLLVSTSFFVFIGFFICMNIIVLIAGGIGIMIDSFSNGPFTFPALFNFAGFLFALFVIFWVLFGFSSIIALKYFLIAFLTLYIFVIYFSVRFSHRLNIS